MFRKKNHSESKQTVSNSLDMYFQHVFLQMFLQYVLAKAIYIVYIYIYSSCNVIPVRPRKDLVKDLGGAFTELEHACTWDELGPGKPITRSGLKVFLDGHKKTAVGAQEKLAGFLARIRSRQ